MKGEIMNTFAFEFGSSEAADKFVRWLNGRGDCGTVTRTWHDTISHHVEGEARATRIKLVSGVAIGVEL